MINLKYFETDEQYVSMKCTLEDLTVSYIEENDLVILGGGKSSSTSVYRVVNTSNPIKLMSDEFASKISKMTINGVEMVDPTNEYQFDEYGVAEIEFFFCELTEIPDNAFSDCNFLTNIVIPDSVTKIGNNAFSNCYSLREIDIPNGVTSIGNGAFNSCHSLTSITIPDSVTEIDASAFENCYTLTSITIPNSVTSIGTSAFTNCASLNEITIGNSVTSIGDYAFYGCYSLREITIPNGVTSIGNEVFSGCYSLISITIPNSVTEIGSSAFTKCYSLREITIPNGVTSIGERTFSYCQSLREITIPNGVTSIGERAFYDCDSLRAITIPDSVTSIGERAFYGCYSLSEIAIPNSVTSIGNNTFQSCYSLSEITCLAETAPTVSSNTFNNVCSNGVLYYPQGSDYSLYLSTSSYYLGYYNWVSVELQDSYDFKVNFITNGVRVESPYSILSINGINGVKQSDKSYLFSGLQAISGCYEFDLIADGEVIDRVDIKHNNKWIVIGDNSTMLTCIYKSCKNVNLYNGSNLNYSDAYVDGEYVGTLSSSYTFNDISEHIIQYEGVTTIGNGAFKDCHSLREIDIPNGVTSIGHSAFTSCYSLSSIDIPNSVTEIGIEAFHSCPSLKEITIPSGVTSINKNTFTNCHLLREITIPNGVTEIDGEAFDSCYSLREIIIPNGVTDLNYRQFYACYSLSSITMPNSITSITTNVFNNCYSLSSITIPDSVIEIGGGLFKYCSSLREITIPKNVILLRGEVFGNCSLLTSITIPSSLTEIGSSAFTNCYSLSEINIPNGVTSIGAKVFSGCSSLTNITIPDSVTSIGNSAFTKCYSLSEITCLAKKAPTVSSKTFSNVSSLGVVYYMQDSDYSSYDAWKEYLPNWDFVPISQKCTNLVISAEDVNAIATSTTISYTATTNIVDINGNIVNDVELTGTIISEPFGMNYQLYDVNRTITFEYFGATESTVITQGANTIEYVYTPQECTNLVISAEDVSCEATSTTISYTATTNGVNKYTNEVISNIEITNTITSAPFEQNTSYTDEVIRTITFEYLGATASTTITQGVWIKSYSIDLNNQWQLSTTIANPDSSLYDGVYESFSNIDVDDTAAICTITIKGYDNFKLYVRSDAESYYDFVVVSNLDCTLSYDTIDGPNVKMTTEGYQESGTAITDYTLVEFSDIDGGEHTIQVMYTKDSSDYDGADQGYLLIPKNQ